jgi:hypothetical protein
LGFLIKEIATYSSKGKNREGGFRSWVSTKWPKIGHFWKFMPLLLKIKFKNSLLSEKLAITSNWGSRVTAASLKWVILPSVNCLLILKVCFPKHFKVNFNLVNFCE